MTSKIPNNDTELKKNQVVNLKVLSNLILGSKTRNCETTIYGF